MIAKSFPPKQIPIKKFWSKIFYDCKIISSKTGSYQKILVENFYDCKIISSKTGSYQKILVENILFSQNHFLETRFLPKIPIKNFLVEHFLWSQNHFLENRFLQQLSSTIFCSKIFLVANSFPPKHVATINLHKIIFGRKFFYGRKIISSQTGSYQKFLK